MTIHENMLREHAAALRRHVYPYVTNEVMVADAIEELLEALRALPVLQGEIGEEKDKAFTRSDQPQPSSITADQRGDDRNGSIQEDDNAVR